MNVIKNKWNGFSTLSQLTKKKRIMCVICTAAVYLSLSRVEKKNHNSLRAVDICRLIVVVVVVISFYFICFQLFWVFFLVSFQSVPLNCVSVVRWAQIEF